MRDFLLFYRRLGDEMRSMSLEKSRQREAELAQEIERLQMEIKTLQKNSEEAANVNQQLSKEVREKKCIIEHNIWHLYFQVKDVEDQISQRKAEVEKLIQEMREVNMESLAISPPEESKQFLDGKSTYFFHVLLSLINLSYFCMQPTLIAA